MEESKHVIKYTDPTPWVHRWPNDRKGVRSELERCTVDQCEATHEPREMSPPGDVQKPGWFARALGIVRKRING